MNIRWKSKVIFDKKVLCFGVLSILLMLCSYQALYKLYRFSSMSATWSYIPVIPLISVFFFFRSRKSIFTGTGFSLPLGAVVIAAGIAGQFSAFAFRSSLHEIGYLATAVVFFLGSFFGIFILCFGVGAFRRALFPLLLLLFMVPMPSSIERIAVEVFRWGSEEMVAVYFSIGGVFFIREGTTFHLDRLSFHVADACSGIHSGLSLLIVSIIAGKLFLHSRKSRLLFSLAILPIAWLKNGMRIATLTLLSNYVNMDFLHGPLHRQGGRPFFVVGLAMLGAWFFACRAVERKLWRSPRS